ncbi:MAG: hypothetical protein ACRBDI_08010 [Alphaproteobacteria bacterium]
MKQQGDNYSSISAEWGENGNIQAGDMIVSPQEVISNGKKTEVLHNNVEQPAQPGYADITQPVVVDTNPQQSNEVPKSQHQTFQMG